MGSLDSEFRVCAWNSIEFDRQKSLDSEPLGYSDSETLGFSDSETNSEADSIESAYSALNREAKTFKFDDSVGDSDGLRPQMMKKKKKNQVFLEGYVEAKDEDDLMRTKSLTDEDLDELKGCLDLGFGFSYEEIPELCNTLPALELCYSMSQKYLDDKQKTPESPTVNVQTSSPASSPIANWKISSPGDHPEDVKARLKYWAQAVACTVRLCS